MPKKINYLKNTIAYTVLTLWQACDFPVFPHVAPGSAAMPHRERIYCLKHLRMRNIDFATSCVAPLLSRWINLRHKMLVSYQI